MRENHISKSLQVIGCQFHTRRVFLRKQHWPLFTATNTAQLFADKKAMAVSFYFDTNSQHLWICWEARGARVRTAHTVHTFCTSNLILLFVIQWWRIDESSLIGWVYRPVQNWGCCLSRKSTRSTSRLQIESISYFIFFFGNWFPEPTVFVQKWVS